jgi:hypothetical protein
VRADFEQALLALIAQRLEKTMSDRGGDTANQYDHVHIATDGGGYPRDGQTYLR